VLGLARPMLRLLGRDDRGAYGVLIAVLVTGGVLLGIGALGVDVGQIYQNRAELQNGADAGALGVAKSCALGTCNTAVAGTYALANASALTGHQAAVTLVCGQSATGGLGSCNTGNSGAITDCPANPPAGVNYVDVHAATLTSGGTLLPPVFARTLIGAKNYNGTRVFACAQAEWGPAEQSNSLAITLSYCDWLALTSGGNPFGTLIPVYLKGTKEKSCSGPAGQNEPGGFGWLTPTSSGVCTAVIDLLTNTTYNDPGNNITAACKEALQTNINSYNAGTPVVAYLPVFGSTGGSGNNGTYGIIGLAGFVVTGYKDLSGGGGQNNYGPANALCTAHDPCIEGYFLPGIDPVTSIGGGTNFGAIAVKLTG